MSFTMRFSILSDVKKGFTNYFCLKLSKISKSVMKMKRDYSQVVLEFMYR